MSWFIKRLQGECLSNNECPDHRACINYQCVDPCIGKCATGASCEAKAHLAVCRCPAGQSGDALVSCRQTRTFPVAKYHWDGTRTPATPHSRGGIANAALPASTWRLRLRIYRMHLISDPRSLITDRGHPYTHDIGSCTAWVTCKITRNKWKLL